MNTPNNQSIPTNEDRQDLISFVRPIHISLSETREGWDLKISSLEPGDAMLVLTRNDLFEQPTILCGTGVKNWVACVDGPVEVGDANAIISSISSSNSPLSVECRMHAHIASEEQGGITAHVRIEDDAYALVAEAMRQYVSNLLNCHASSPDLGLIATVFERGTVLSIRPIETEVYATFLDIGICTSEEGAAELSLIYDIHANSWHGE
ncbi:MAG: hypothetical protein QGI78_02725 [Phycisphaerales bacterium]|jgi:hypothetical protein|nr:hypothetical protein [Phycisphaerales bacterium]